MTKAICPYTGHEYQLGDIVRINDELDIFGTIAISEMRKFCGQHARITKILRHINKCYFLLDNGNQDLCGWKWEASNFTWNKDSPALFFPAVRSKQVLFVSKPIPAVSDKIYLEMAGLDDRSGDELW